MEVWSDGFGKIFFICFCILSHPVPIDEGVVEAVPEVAEAPAEPEEVADDQGGAPSDRNPY